MGVDHKAGQAAPDPTSHDHEGSSAFDVWATRDHGDGPAVPAETSHAPADSPVLPGPTPDDQEDGPALPSRVSGDQESAPALPTRIPADQEAAPALPTRTPGNHEGAVLPTRTPGNQGGAPLPSRMPGRPDSATTLPARTPPGRDGTPALPARTPGNGEGSPALPARTPGNGEGSPALPTRTTPGAEGGPVLPVRTSGARGDGSALPVRTTRYRRSGRHSSPHQLSLPSDTPALVIAVPGSARPESEETVIRIAEMAASSCHGAEVRIGYLRGGRDSLEEVLDELGTRPVGPAAVVVPLLAFPNAEADAAIADIVATSQTPLLTAAHLGPHPLLAEALHARLADAGLARAARVGRISIVTAADGVIVGTAGEEEAIEGAGVVAVLLASRLTMPVAAASLTDPASIKDAANRLREARVTRVALAPCMIGPELTSGTLDAIAALTSTDCASPLGGHSAVAQLVAIRYGAALADPQVATMMAEARGDPLPAAPMPAPVPPSAPAT